VSDKKFDPQVDLLKLAEETNKNPKFVLNAYKDTQPVPIFDRTTPEVQELAFLQGIK